MPLKFFAIPALQPEQATEELNRFLRGHRALGIERQFLATGGGATWCLAVEYLEQPVGATSGPADASRRNKIDYKEVLSADEFTRFSKLRELRKQIAEGEAVPVYAVFTNEQLAAIARRQPDTPSALQAIDGIGDSKTKNYGARVLAVLASLAPVGVAGETLAPAAP